MKLVMTCKTCEFCNGENSICSGRCGERALQGAEECNEWSASLEYYSEITEQAPWYIKEPYKRYKISYARFLDYLQKDDAGIGIEINIYDAIERVYELTTWELAGVLDVSVGVIGYARTRKTIAKRKKQFSSRLHIPEEFFDKFLSTQLEELKQCKEKFYEFYGEDTIEKFKQNGINTMNQKLESACANDKILNEMYRENNQYRYQYETKNKMYHDLSDDYKSREYVVAITLKDGDYYGNIFFEYTFGGYGLSVSVMESILEFVEELNCEEIYELNKAGMLNSNIALKSDMDGKQIRFKLKNDSGEILGRVIPEKDLQKYIIGYEMIRCDGHGMKKERRKCISCLNYKPIEGCARGHCLVRGDIVSRSRKICAFHYIPKDS